MPSPSFVVKLADLERGALAARWPIDEVWLRGALAGTEATPRGGPGELTVELMKNGREVLVRGRAHVSVNVPCVVTLDPLPFELEPEIMLLLHPEATPERSQASVPGNRSKAVKAKPPERRGKKPKRADDDSDLSADDGPEDSFSGDEIVLDHFVREFIVLEIPPYPRRSDLPSSEEGISSRPFAGPGAESEPVDPRLAPLVGLARRLRGEANKE